MGHSKQKLAKKIKELIASDGKSVRAWALERGLGQRQVDRMIKADGAVSLDTLDEVAGAVGMEPASLISDGKQVASQSAMALQLAQLFDDLTKGNAKVVDFALASNAVYQALRQSEIQPSGKPDSHLAPRKQASKHRA